LAPVFQLRSREWRFSRRTRTLRGTRESVLLFFLPFRVMTAIRLLKLKGEIP